MLAQGDQPVSFAELFYDLVFVFAITQVVQLMHHQFDAIHVLRAVLVFWLVWWAWTQYSWALNAANTIHRDIQVSILASTAGAFFMAVSVPEAFGESSLWFSLAYFAVRGIGLLIYYWVTKPDEKMLEAVKTFSLLSVAGLISAVVGGYLGGTAQYYLWGLTIVLDMVAAGIAGKHDSWNLHPKHFSERHGLFVIIVLGETLIIAAGAVTQDIENEKRLIISLLSVAITCCLWWIYFFRAKERLEHAMRTRDGAERSRFARDAYSLLHFPLLCGLIIYAYAIQEAMLRPVGVMSHSARLALGIGIFIFTNGIVLTHYRATGRWLYARTLISLATALTIYFLPDLQTFATMLIALAGLISMCVLEEFFPPSRKHEISGLEIE